jgi:acetoin utilization protein AcuA
MSDVRIKRVTDLRQVDVAPGFFAITRTDRLREAFDDVLGIGAVITAAIDRSVVIGYAIDLPFVPIAIEGGELKRRWQSVPDAHELGAIEVARPFRGSGIGRRLLDEVVAQPQLDGRILIAEGLEWHWDLEAFHVSAGERRERLLALFSGAGFQRYDTDETEVAYSEPNFLAARVGPAVSEESRRAFQAALCANPPR